VVASDYSPVVQAFREGQGFDASLASADEEHGERPAIADLYLEIPLAEVMQIIQRPGRPSQTRHRAWDLDRPPPEGWRRVTTWDSQGYWRLNVGPGRSDPLDAWPQGEELAYLATSRAVTAPRDEGWWATCGEPDAMLDHLLKQDDVNWRKVRLWACACVRRIWPRLTSEPGRRAVEVAERFADGRAEQRAVEIAANAVERVRKGDRQANRAASQLARLCCPARRFPPADVSDAVVGAVVGAADSPEERADERKAHAALLRDIFGNPFAATPRIDTSALRWNDGCVVRIAEGIYEERAFERMGVLHDALLDAGCNSDDILSHCREQGGHARGCWLLDLLLNKS
jgi:hypothetical protein